MKKRTKLLFLTICMLVAVPTVAFASYIISNNNIGSFSDVTNLDSNKEIFKITFKNTDGTILKEQYIEKGSILDSNNVPQIPNKRIKWKANDGNVVNVIDLFDENFDTLVPTKDLVFIAEDVPLKTNFDNTSIKNNITNNNPNNPNGNTTTIINGNTVHVKENPTITDKKQVCNDIQLSGALNNVTINSTYRGKSGKKVVDTDRTDLATTENQANPNNEITIGLEDPADKVSMYKPYAGSGNNYCVSRITLSSDLLLTGSKLALGANCGFYGSDYHWSQRNMQGFIIGNYSEIDLNGHNLIIGNGSIFDAIGSITNSIPGKGAVILQNGSSTYATCVIEEQNCERSLPIQYFHGGQVFSYFKMPYLNCDIKIENGAKFYAKIQLDFGGNNKNFIEKDIPLVGPDQSFLIQTNSSNGYIYRKSSFDVNQFNISNTFSKQNLMHQIVTYDFINIPNLIINSVEINAKIDLYNFNIDLGQNGLVIPPYFQFNFFNCNINLPLSLTFLPGSSLYIDKNSTITLTASDFRKFAPPFGSNGLVNMFDYTYQTVGTLNFVMEKYDIRDAMRRPGVQGSKETALVPSNPNFTGQYGWVDDSESKYIGSGGSYIQIRMQSIESTKYWNQQRPAHADICGKILFGNIPSFNNNSLKHELGGNINISDIETFKNTVANRNDVNLYASGAHFGLCYASNAPLLNHKTNITEYFVAPLVSNGNVLMNFSNQGKVRDDYRTNLAIYSKQTGLITYKVNSSNTTTNYAFIHTLDNANWNGSISNPVKVKYNNKSAYEKGKDSYTGKFFKVNSLNSNHSVNVSINANGKNNYIFFRGAMMPFDGTNVFIDKLRGEGSDLKCGMFYNNKQKVDYSISKSLGTIRKVSYLNDSYYDYMHFELTK